MDLRNRHSSTTPKPQEEKCPHGKTVQKRLVPHEGFALLVVLVFLIPFGAVVWFLGYLQIREASRVLIMLLLSFGGLFTTTRLIPKISWYTKKAGLHGKDIGKKSTPEGEKDIPEGLGIVPAFVLLNILIVSQLFRLDNQEELIQLNAALMSICMMTLLGFSDDVLDLPWRFKLILPAFASLPLLVAYNGATTVLLPPPFNTLINMQFFYYVFMASLGIFCTNAINIYAGINGIEVGQSFIVGTAILFHNMVEIYNGEPGSVLRNQHLFSLLLILPFNFVSLGLLVHNRYPSKVFIGDTYCYFAGMTFAVVAILGHFSKTMMLFFIPQILNFVISLPQLLGFIDCPRHRLPSYNTKTGKMECVEEHHTLINAYLKLMGPTREDKLCTNLLIFQLLTCAFGFFLRYAIAPWIYSHQAH